MVTVVVAMVAVTLGALLVESRRRVARLRVALAACSEQLERMTAELRSYEHARRDLPADADAAVARARTTLAGLTRDEHGVIVRVMP